MWTPFTELVFSSCDLYEDTIPAFALPNLLSLLRRQNKLIFICSRVVHPGGRPSWGAFAGAVIGSAVLSLIIGFTCLTYCVGRAEYKDGKKHEDPEAANWEARKRGRGTSRHVTEANGYALSLDETEDEVDNDSQLGKDSAFDGGPLTANGVIHGRMSSMGTPPPSPLAENRNANGVVSTPQTENRKISQFSTGPQVSTPQSGRNKTSVGTPVSTPLADPRSRKISAASPGTPNEKRLAEFGAASPNYQRDSPVTNRPNSAVGTPGSERPGRVGFSKERKDDRKAFLGSKEFLNVTPKGSPGTPRSERTPRISPTQTPVAHSPEFRRRRHNAPPTDEVRHVVIANPNQETPSRRTSDISLSLSIGIEASESEALPSAGLNDQNNGPKAQSAFASALDSTSSHDHGEDVPSPAMSPPDSNKHSVSNATETVLLHNSDPETNTGQPANPYPTRPVSDALSNTYEDPNAYALYAEVGGESEGQEVGDVARHPASLAAAQTNVAVDPEEENAYLAVDEEVKRQCLQPTEPSEFPRQPQSGKEPLVDMNTIYDVPLDSELEPEYVAMDADRHMPPANRPSELSII